MGNAPSASSSSDSSTAGDGRRDVVLQVVDDEALRSLSQAVATTIEKPIPALETTQALDMATTEEEGQQVQSIGMAQGGVATTKIQLQSLSLDDSTKQAPKHTENANNNNDNTPLVTIAAAAAAPQPPPRPLGMVEPNRLRRKRVFVKRTCLDQLGDISHFTFKRARPIPRSQASLTTTEASSSSASSSTSSASSTSSGGSSSTSSSGSSSSSSGTGGTGTGTGTVTSNPVSDDDDDDDREEDEDDNEHANSQTRGAAHGKRVRKPSAKLRAMEKTVEKNKNKRSGKDPKRNPKEYLSRAGRRGAYGANRAKSLPDHVQPTDVLLSTRRQTFDHVGNRIYLYVVRHHFPTYMAVRNRSLRRDSKSLTVTNVIDNIIVQLQQLLNEAGNNNDNENKKNKTKMRFLNGDFREASTRQVRDAVLHTLRSEMKAQLFQQKVKNRKGLLEQKLKRQMAHSHDVVRGADKHEGNLALRQFCADVQDEFLAAHDEIRRTPDEVQHLQQRIIDSVLWRVQRLDPPGRFLMRKAVPTEYSNSNQEAATSQKKQYRVSNMTLEQARADVRAILEASTTTTAARGQRTIYTKLTEHDVILGSADESVHANPNSYFRRLCIKAACPVATTAMRSRAVDFVYRRIRDHGGRFVERRSKTHTKTGEQQQQQEPASTIQYVPISEARARQFILQALQNSPFRSKTAAATTSAMEAESTVAKDPVDLTKPTNAAPSEALPDASAALSAAVAPSMLETETAAVEESATVPAIQLAPAATAPAPVVNEWREVGGALAAAPAAGEKAVVPAIQPVASTTARAPVVNVWQEFGAALAAAAATGNQAPIPMDTDDGDAKMPAKSSTAENAATGMAKAVAGVLPDPLPKQQASDAERPSTQADSQEKPITVDLSEEPETEKGRSAAIRMLGPSDVICGNAVGESEHIGNKIYQNVCANARVTYKAARCSMKWRVAEWIVRHIHSLNPPGRFLLISDSPGNILVELPLDAARQKVMVDLQKIEGGADPPTAIPLQFLCVRDPQEPAGPQRNLDQQSEKLRVPHPHDVIVGGAPEHLQHPGNQTFLKYCWNARHAYSSARPDGAPAVVELVIKAVFARSPPGRFLTLCKDGVFTDASIEQMRKEVHLRLLEGIAIASIPEGVLSDKPIEFLGEPPQQIQPELHPALQGERHKLPNAETQFLVLPHYSVHAQDEDVLSVAEESMGSHSATSPVHEDNLLQQSPLKSYYEEALVHPDGVDPTIVRGTRLAVYWPLDAAYYNGAVEERIQNFVRMEYDDGITEWLDLTKHKYRILPTVQIKDEDDKLDKDEVMEVVEDATGVELDKAADDEAPAASVEDSSDPENDNPPAENPASDDPSPQKVNRQIKNRPEPEFFVPHSKVTAQVGYKGMAVDDVMVQIPSATESYLTEKKHTKNVKAVSAIKKLIAVPPPPVSAERTNKTRQSERRLSKEPIDSASSAVAAKPPLDTPGSGLAPGKTASDMITMSHSEKESTPDPSSPLSVEECRMLVSLAARFGPKWFEVAPQKGLEMMIKTEFPGRTIDSLTQIWESQILPAITAFVREQKGNDETSDQISKVDYERYDVGILHAAARSQVMNRPPDVGAGDDK